MTFHDVPLAPARPLFEAVGPEDAVTVARPRIDETGEGARFVLTVVEGPDRGLEFALDGTHASRVLLGSSPACELRLSDREVSRRHVALELAGRRLRLCDLGSTNGTWVDGVAVVEALLSGGETLRVGSTALGVERRRAGPSPAPPEAAGFGRVVGQSAEMRRLYPLLDRLARSTVPVVIEGETGTGKEAVAESLHEIGPRAAQPFVVFDCTAVPPSLLESELFGHERGAFTGATSARRGVFEQAHGGTLLIDEIGDLDLVLQPKLLRAIERSEIRRVGGERTQKVDVRILAATRRDLDHEVQAGRFRDDLYHRLMVARVELPPLRARHGDVPVLARHFARELGGDGELSNELLGRWQDWSWPGNVRELRNAVARRMALGDLAAELGSVGGADEGSSGGTARDPIDDVLELELPLVQARARIVEAFERRYIQRVLSRHGGSVPRAAAASGIARRYFQILKARQGI